MLDTMLDINLAEANSLRLEAKISVPASLFLATICLKISSSVFAC